MSELFDSSNRFLYNTELEQIIERAVEKAVSCALSALTNLDNGTGHTHDSSLCAKPTLTVDEAAKYIGVSRPKMYEMTRAQGFPAIHVGRRILINRQSLLRWLEEGDSYGKKTR